MSSMVNFQSFTRALTLFCLIVFLYTLMPDDIHWIKSFLKYIVIISLIIILMMYNKILSGTPDKINESMNHKNNIVDVITVNNTTFKNSFKDLTDQVLLLAKSINPNSTSAIYIIDPDKHSFVLQTEHENKFLDLIPIQNAIVQDYIYKEKNLHQKDNPDLWNDLFRRQNWRGSECAIFCPIILKGNTAGFILSMVDHFTDVKQKEKDVFSYLGKFISFGLENLGKLEQHVNGEYNKSLILDILSNIDFKSDEIAIFNRFKLLIVSSFQYDRLSISFRKETENRREYDKGLNLTIKAIDGDKDEFIEGIDFPTNGSLHGLPVINGESILTANWQESHSNLFRFSSNESDEHIYKSVLGVPIIVDNQNKGSIIIERRNEKCFIESDRNNLEIIGNVLGSALYWKNEYEKIYINATHDGLSKLLNHQTFKERFRDEIQRAARFQHKMAIMIFDLDKFKKVNDTLGHQYGDYVIQTVAKIMEANVRAVDVVARYGGEEFAIILINTTAAMSNVVAKRIVANIADYNFSMNNIETKITISGGMSEYPTHTKGMKELIEYADQAMYATKQNGGNGITIHNDV